MKYILIGVFFISVKGEEVLSVALPGEQYDAPWASLGHSTKSNNEEFDTRHYNDAPDIKRTKCSLPADKPISARVNDEKDISKYFDCPNKENISSGNRQCLVRESRTAADNQPPSSEQQQDEMGTNLSRHNGKGLTGRRTQSSGNLCDSKGKHNNKMSGTSSQGDR